MRKLVSAPLFAWLFLFVPFPAFSKSDPASFASTVAPCPGHATAVFVAKFWTLLSVGGWVRVGAQ